MPLAGAREPRRRHSSGDRLRSAPRAARVTGGNKAHAQLCTTRRVEVIGQPESCGSARGRLVDGQSWNKVVNAAAGTVDRYAANRGPARPGGVQRMADDDVIGSTRAA